MVCQLVRGGVGGWGKGWGRVRQPPPGVSSPPLPSLPGAPPLLSSSVTWLWSLGCCGSRAGWEGGGVGCSGVEWEGGGAEGHWRRSSVSDRENAITTSSAPEKWRQKGQVSPPDKCKLLGWWISSNMLFCDKTKWQKLALLKKKKKQGPSSLLSLLWMLWMEFLNLQCETSVSPFGSGSNYTKTYFSHLL